MATGVEIVSELAEKWNAHDLDAVYGFLTDDYREYMNGSLAKTGPAEARAADEVLFATFPDYHRVVDEVWGVGDRVVARFVIRGTAADGTTLELPVACVYGITDGRISEAHLYFDSAAFATS